MGIGRELEAQRRDGSTVPVEISLSPVQLEEGPRIMAVVRDISERKQLRSWGTEALEAAEEERLRIAQELHDDLAQRLAALQVGAKLVGRRSGTRSSASWTTAGS
ncbi:MAG: histidine kinase, partial [Gemmatimonadota bacterium]